MLAGGGSSELPMSENDDDAVSDEIDFFNCAGGDPVADMLSLDVSWKARKAVRRTSVAAAMTRGGAVCRSSMVARRAKIWGRVRSCEGS
jgi:hypothetical protein